MSTREPDIEDYFRGKIFSKLVLLDTLYHINRNLITKYTILDIRSVFKVSTLYSNILYRYNYRVFP
jgi:hypothetical protein